MAHYFKDQYDEALKNLPFINSGINITKIEVWVTNKTGTTNDLLDAWFAGFNSDIVTVTWMGYDQPKSLGKSESGARAALPIWIDYMRVALDGVAERNIAIPETVVSGYVSEETGEAVPSDHPKAYEEYFKAPYPARSCVEVPALPKGALIEIEVIASR